MSASQADSAEALAQLLAALSSSSSAVSSDPEAKEKLKNVADQLGAFLSGMPGGNSAANGQMLNEDGEPIVEITEHVPDLPSSATSSAPIESVPEEQLVPVPDPIPSSALTDEDIERRRRARNALLDQLEAEEEEEERLALAKSHRAKNAKAAAVTPPTAGMSTSKPPASDAVISPINVTGINSELVPRIVERAPSLSLSIPPTAPSPSNPPFESSSTSITATSTVKSPSKSKSVSFASDVKPEAPPAPSQQERSRTHDSLRALAMNVVEKPPAGADPVTPSASTTSNVLGMKFKPRHVQIRQAEVDSDDEDEDDNDGQDEDDSEQDLEDEDEDDEEEDEEEDWDEAMLQRELALAYVEQQGMLKDLRASAEVPLPPGWSPDMGSWEQEHVPLDASLASNKHRSSISRFKAERTAQYQASNPLPADPFLAAEVRHGKLVDGELVGGLDESDDEEDENGLNENARRTIALLMGKVPPSSAVTDDHASLSTVPVPEPEPVPAKPPAPPLSSGVTSESEDAPKRKVSRFKQAQQAGASDASTTAPTLTTSRAQKSSSALSSVIERATPSKTSSSIDVQPASSPKLRTTPNPKTGPKLAGALITSTPPIASRSAIPPTFSSFSSAPPTSAESANGGVPFTSVVLTPEEAARGAALPSPAPVRARQKTPVMVPTVAERGARTADAIALTTSRSSTSVADKKPQRVSRFKAERM